MLVELRTYKTKPGKRDQFIQIFREKARPAQEQAGIRILGEFCSLEDADTFIWLRAFDNNEMREKLLNAFYASDYWLNELRAQIVPLLDTYSGHLIEPTDNSPIR